MPTFFKRTLTFLCPLLFLGVYSHAIQFQGTLTDGDFSGQDSLRVELVETGTILPITFQQPFELQLPPDTLWNLCVSTDSLEKCYELLYLGSDSSFQPPSQGMNRSLGLMMGVKSAPHCYPIPIPPPLKT